MARSKALEPAGVMTLDAGTSSGLAWGIMRLDRCEDLTSFEIVKRDLIGTSTISEETEKKSSDLIFKRFRHLAFNWNVRASVPMNRIFFVYEDFILRAGSHSSKRSGLSSPRIAERVSALVTNLFPGVPDPDEHKQTPSQAKSIATDERLRANGLWVPGCPHENDAVRHLVVWVRKNTQ